MTDGRLVLVDANVLLDVFTADKVWLGWSSQALAAAADRGGVGVNPIIYAEVSLHFSRLEDLDAALPETEFLRLSLPWPAAFLAGRRHLDYRRAGGSRRTPLPDFLIGAHAEVDGLTILTRDARRYRTYFPDVTLIAP